MIILHTLHLLFLYFETPCVLCSPNLDEVSVCFTLFGCRLLLMNFVVSSMVLILSLFLSCSRFFVISVLSLLYVETYAKGSLLLCFLAFIVLLMVFFLLFRIPNLLLLPVIPSCGGLRVIVLGEFV